MPGNNLWGQVQLNCWVRWIRKITGRYHFCVTCFTQISSWLSYLVSYISWSETFKVVLETFRKMNLRHMSVLDSKNGKSSDTDRALLIRPNQRFPLLLQLILPAARITLNMPFSNSRRRQPNHIFSAFLWPLWIGKTGAWS